MIKPKDTPQVINGLYRHSKSGYYYVVTGFRHSEANAGQMVDYFSLYDGTDWSRSAAEFIAKFTLVPHSALLDLYSKTRVEAPDQRKWGFGDEDESRYRAYRARLIDEIYVSGHLLDKKGGVD